MRRGVFVRMVVVVGLVAGTIVTATPVGAVTTWKVTPIATPPAPPYHPLAAVSCATPASCFAVGGTTVERWDGTSWSIVPNAAPDPVSLKAVSCAGSANCLAVGDFPSQGFTKPFSEKWDGSGWSIAPIGDPGYTDVPLEGVSCPSATSCFAVGQSTIEHWDGGKWSVVASPSPGSDTAAISLFAVSCASLTSCFAVGRRVDLSGAGFALTEQWDGTSWAIVSAPTPKTGNGATLSGAYTTLAGVSCSSAASCVAVGYTPNHALIEHWDGASWSIGSSPKPPGAADEMAKLNAVSCSSAADCTVAGEMFRISNRNDEPDFPLIASIAMHWGGSVWTIVARPNGAPASGRYGQLIQLTGVSCASSMSCAAVGNSSVAERWDGTRWTLAPFASSSPSGELRAVACPTESDCFAVGSYAAIAGSRTLIEHWNGTNWSVVPSPNVSGTDALSALYAVACTASTRCTAVGLYTKGITPRFSIQQLLIEQWNGKTWSIAASPQPANSSLVGLSGVSCPSAANCMATGFYSPDTGENATRPLAERWDGKRWSIVPTPGPAGGLGAVSCPSPTTCFAAGFGSRQMNRWNGKTWSIVAIPRPVGRHGVSFSSVSCPSTTACTAIGFSRASLSAPRRQLVEQFDGSKWSIVSSPSPAIPAEFFPGSIACTSAASCDAVGFQTFVVGNELGSKLLAEHGNGTKWSVVTGAALPGAMNSQLSSIACPTPIVCISLGSSSLGVPGGNFSVMQRG